MMCSRRRLCDCAVDDLHGHQRGCHPIERAITERAAPLEHLVGIDAMMTGNPRDRQGSRTKGLLDDDTFEFLRMMPIPTATPRR